jgi:hypothetical protein
VEERVVADRVWLLDEGNAAVADRLVKALDGRKAAIGERSSTNAQRCSAGCSSRLWAGWKTRRMPSLIFNSCGVGMGCKSLIFHESRIGFLKNVVPRHGAF